MEKPKLLIAENQDYSLEVIKKLEPHVDITQANLEDNQLEWALKEHDIIWFRLAFQFDRQILSTPNIKCRTLVTPVTGIDHIDEQACHKLGIKILCLRDETEFLQSVRATAELTLGLTLALLRKIPSASASVLNGNWNRDEFRGREISGKTVAVIGLGRLGKMTAKLFESFGAKIIYNDLEEVAGSKYEYIPSLNACIGLADIISIHVSYDPSTRHLLGSQEFEHFKPGAILINTSRGGVIDQQALLEGLKSGRLAGAGLDVLEGEPNVRANALVSFARDNDNLLIVPHIGGNTRESFLKTEHFVANKLIEHLNTDQS